MEFAVSTEFGDEGKPSYTLAPGACVRMEPFGLLFYHRNGPRLFFLSSRGWINPDFFTSGQTLREWLQERPVPDNVLQALEKALLSLEIKGVLCACRSGPAGALRPGQPHVGSHSTL
jgi:putative mycofactocin binding protein MftB